MNVAVQVLGLSTVTVVVVLVPEQLPPQLVKEYPEAGAAVSVTDVEPVNVTEHVPVPLVPQLIPPPVTVPPVGGVTASEYVGVVDVNVAPQVRAPDRRM